MTDTKISKNPLKGYAVVFGIGTVLDASMLWADYLEGRVDAFHAAALLQAIGLLIFYFKKSKYAVRYLFYSSLPFFPLYFGLKAIGLNPPPATGTTYVIAAAFFAGIFPLYRKLRRDHDQYLATIEQPPAQVTADHSSLNL